MKKSMMKWMNGGDILSNEKTLKQVLHEIFPSIDVRKILDYYEVDYTVKGDECSMRCPFHSSLVGKEDKNPSFSINYVKKVYACWSCPAKGSIYQLVMQLEVLYGNAKSCNFHTALIKVCEICNIEVDNIFKVSKDSFNEDMAIEDIISDECNIQEVFNESVLNKFYLKSHNYFLDKGYSANTLKTFEMGFGVKGLDKDRCIFPIRNVTGGLVGWTGRTIKPDGKPKWLHRPKDRFYTTLNLFNIDKALAYIINSGDVYVVESVGNCMRMWEAGHRNTVAVFGNKLSTEQADILCEYANHIFLLYDPDEAGSIGNNIAVNLLYDRDVEVSIGVYDFGVDKNGKALDIGDADKKMIDSITYIDMYEYIERNGGLMKILDEEFVLDNKSITIQTSDSSVILTDKINKDCEYPQLCMNDILYIRRINSMFGISGMDIEPGIPF